MADQVISKFTSVTLVNPTQEVRAFFGRPELRIRDLRHSFANFLVGIGISQRDLRTILGYYKPQLGIIQ